MAVKMPSILASNGLVNRSIFASLLQNESFFKGVLLDIGCGEQPYADLVKRRCTKYISTDMEVRSENLDVIGDSLSLPYKDRTFDSILCTEVLEHVSEPSKLFTEVARTLKIGGSLVLTTPMAWPLHEEPYDYFRYTRYGLIELSKSAGLKVCSINERGGPAVTLAQIVGILMYESCKGKRLRWILFKSFIVPIYVIAKVLDKAWHDPKLTLGYTLVATKETSENGDSTTFH